MVKPIPVAQERTQIGRSSQCLSLKRTIDLGLATETKGNYVAEGGGRLGPLDV